MSRSNRHYEYRRFGCKRYNAISMLLSLTAIYRGVTRSYATLFIYEPLSIKYLTIRLALLEIAYIRADSPKWSNSAESHSSDGRRVPPKAFSRRTQIRRNRPGQLSIRLRPIDATARVRRYAAGWSHGRYVIDADARSDEPFPRVERRSRAPSR